MYCLTYGIGKFWNWGYINIFNVTYYKRQIFKKKTHTDVIFSSNSRLTASIRYFLIVHYAWTFMPYGMHSIEILLSSHRMKFRDKVLRKPRTCCQKMWAPLQLEYSERLIEKLLKNKGWIKMERVVLWIVKL